MRGAAADIARRLLEACAKMRKDLPRRHAFLSITCVLRLTRCEEGRAVESPIWRERAIWRGTRSGRKNFSAKDFLSQQWSLRGVEGAGRRA